MKKKHVKMVLMAEPGTGKTTFISNAPSVLLIATDGNWEWVDFQDDAIIQPVTSWDETKKVIGDVINGKYESCETVVLDLIEDAFMWHEMDWCKKHRIEHPGDMDFGKGYDMINKDFFAEIAKLIAVDKNVIFITHSFSKDEKTRSGKTEIKYIPNNRIRDKLWDMIEGRVRYFLRAYMKGEPNETGKIVKKRYLSIVPKENESFCIARGIDEATTPSDIELDWNVFAEVIGLNENPEPIAKPVTVKPTKPAVEEKKLVKKVTKKVETPVEEVVTAPVEEVVATPVEEVVETPTVVEVPTPVEEKPAVVETPVAQPKSETSGSDKLANIRAKMDAIKNRKK